MAPNSTTTRKQKQPRKKRKKNKNKSSSSSSSRAIIPPPHETMMKSRKRARQVTTLFHKYTRERDEVMKKFSQVQDRDDDDHDEEEYNEKEEKKETLLTEVDEKIESIGGRKAYQQASQLSTSFHSTSKWVLGSLQRNGWLYGIPITDDDDDDNDNNIKDKKKNYDDDDCDSSNNSKSKRRKRKRKGVLRRETKLLEVGAINTELLDASERTTTTTNADDHDDDDNKKTGRKKYRLHVRAIDLHSMHPGRIEEGDFLKLPLPTSTSNNNQQQFEEQRYDVIVNSMVLNCVTTPEDRGEMLIRLYQFLRPGGIVFLTIPKLCLNQSPYINRDQFLKLLGPTGVGFEIVRETKESPKVAFFVCRRPHHTPPPSSSTVIGDNNKDKSSFRRGQHQQKRSESSTSSSSLPLAFDTKWTKLHRQRKEKKFRNQFAVVLNKERCLEARE